MRAARTLAHVLNQGVPVNYLLIKSLLSFQNTAQLPHRERASAHKAPIFLRGVAVKFKFVWTLTLVVGLGFSNLAAPAGKDDKPVTETAVAAAKNLAVVWPMAATYTPEPELKRPALLPALYTSLAAVQAWDLYSTSMALKAGAHEANAAAAPFASNKASMLGLKLATTAGTILCTERMWKKNRVGAVALMVAINGATAAVAMHNMHNARPLAGR
jgi:hypothetical protein